MLGAFTTVLGFSQSVDFARTAAFLALVFTQLIHVFECKSESRSLFRIRIFNNMKLVWAVLSSAIIVLSTVYSPALNPIFKTVRAHRGIDIGVPTGTPVYAAASGTVIKSLYNGSYGYYVAIDHGGGIVTLYAHNSQLLVSAGQTVTQGQTIAKAGSTGNSTGPHVHFEVQVNGSVVNPRNYF